MKSYKQRTLEAQLDLIRRYEENDPPIFCPFCQIYFYPHTSTTRCKGCFLKLKDHNYCIETDSFMNSSRMSSHSEEERLARAKFHKKMRKILLKRDAKYFTPSKWKYFPINLRW
jgi:hypothetical protein